MKALYLSVAVIATLAWFYAIIIKLEIAWWVSLFWSIYWWVKWVGLLIDGAESRIKEFEINERLGEFKNYANKLYEKDEVEPIVKSQSNRKD